MLCCLGLGPRLEYIYTHIENIERDVWRGQSRRRNLYHCITITCLRYLPLPLLLFDRIDQVRPSKPLGQSWLTCSKWMSRLHSMSPPWSGTGHAEMS